MFLQETDSSLAAAVLTLTEWHAALARGERPDASPRCTGDALVVDASGARPLASQGGTMSGAPSSRAAQPCCCRRDCRAGTPLSTIEQVQHFGPDMIALRLASGGCGRRSRLCGPPLATTYLMRRHGDDWRVCLIADTE